MVCFPNCKINLGLRITHKRADGYHDLETIFYPVPLKDALEIIRGTGEGVVFSQSGLSITGNHADNLCVRAWHLLKADFPQLPGISMHLHKQIPMGAGLGGGSSDGAFALTMLNSLFNLDISQELMEKYALALGSDCPFFLRNRPVLATGRGEIMTDVGVDLSSYRIVFVNPGIHISTARAFAGIVPRAAGQALTEIIGLHPAKWKASLVNDFEQSVFAANPIAAAIKEELYTLGAVYASMTGSGSTLYGLFPESVNIPVTVCGFPTVVAG